MRRVWDGGPTQCSSIKTTKRKREKGKELVCNSPQRNLNQPSTRYLEIVMVKCFLWILFQKWEDNLHYSGKYTYVCIICSGSKGSLKSVAMITISESDNWEINSSSGMKYGHFVDWEKIDPEAAARYKQILKSSHQQLKTMAREGFWATPHTLRAKAYYHIIHGINSRLRLFHCILSIVVFNRYFL